MNNKILYIAIFLAILITLFLSLGSASLGPFSLYQKRKLGSESGPNFETVYSGGNLQANVKPNAAINSGNTSFSQSSNGASQVRPLVPHEWPATVQIKNKKYDLNPNAIGSYPRLTVLPKAIIPIHLQIKPGDNVQVQVLDGGTIDGKMLSRLQASDDVGNIDFNFQVKTAPGSYRVAVYHGGQRQIFDFWVGPDLPQRVGAAR